MLDNRPPQSRRCTVPTAQRTFVMFAAIVLTLGTSAILAQQTQPRAQPKTAQGELLRVDDAARLLVIRTEAPPREMQFHYTAQTKVTGADRGIEGLATMAGAQVIVQYTQQDKD